MKADEGAFGPAEAASSIEAIPYVAYLGIRLEWRDESLAAFLPFREDLIGNPAIPALHGGVVASLLEVTALAALAIHCLCGDSARAQALPVAVAPLFPSRTEATGQEAAQGAAPLGSPDPVLLPGRGSWLPETVDFTVEYLRPAGPAPCHAAATVARAGRRYASVHAVGWQGDRTRPFAQAGGTFLAPRPGGGSLGGPPA